MEKIYSEKWLSNFDLLPPFLSIWKKKMQWLVIYKKTFCRKSEGLKDKSSSLMAIYRILSFTRADEAPAARYLRNLNSDRRMWTPTMIDDVRLRALSIYTVYLYVTSDVARTAARSESIADERRAKYPRCY